MNSELLLIVVLHLSVPYRVDPEAISDQRKVQLPLDGPEYLPRCSVQYEGQATKIYSEPSGDVNEIAVCFKKPKKSNLQCRGRINDNFSPVENSYTCL